jgi:hypothetical protein
MTASIEKLTGIYIRIGNPSDKSILFISSSSKIYSKEDKNLFPYANNFKIGKNY